MSKVVIARCPGCKPHKFQDEKYGDKMRVFNLMKAATGKGRCTVCTATIQISNPKTDDKKKENKNANPN